jgi:hypothetical protein
VTDKPVKNVAHSVRQRLMNEARRTGRLYNEIEQYYAMERSRPSTRSSSTSRRRA